MFDYINMASTRSKNTIGNYNLEQRDNCQILHYDLYENGQSGRAFKDALPCLGYNPSFMGRDSFANNSIDIKLLVVDNMCFCFF